MRMSVIGCGYLGAVHAASMAKLGHEVVGVDVDTAKVEALAAGRAPFYEPGLPELLAETSATPVSTSPRGVTSIAARREVAASRWQWSASTRTCSATASAVAASG